MAKTNMVERELRRAKVAKRYAAKRAELKLAAVNIHLNLEERMAAQQKLQALPRDANPIRQQRRCRMCGRPRGVYRRFGLCRIHLRENAMTGKVPGITKSSW